MSKTKIKHYLLLLALVILISCEKGFSVNDPQCKEKQAIYIIVAEIGSMRENGDKKRIPPTGIFKLEINQQTSEYQLKKVLSIDTLITTNVKTYLNEGLVFIETSSKSDSDYSDLNIISMDSPWVKKSCLVHYSEFYFPLKMNGKMFLVSYMYPNNTNVPKAKLTEILNLKTKDVSLDFMSRINGGPEWFKLRDKIYFSNMGMENIALPYTFPNEFRQNTIEMRMEESNNDKVVVFAIPDKKSKTTKILWLNKENNIWQQQLVKGDASITKVLGPFIVVCVGSFNPKKHPLEPPEMTGEWDFIDIENGNKQLINYRSYSNIIFAEENFILAVNEHKLLYIPIEKNILQLQNTKVILTEQSKNIRTSKEIVNYMKDAFWGPK